MPNKASKKNAAAGVKKATAPQTAKKAVASRSHKKASGKAAAAKLSKAKQPAAKPGVIKKSPKPSAAKPAAAKAHQTKKTPKKPPAGKPVGKPVRTPAGKAGPAAEPKASVQSPQSKPGRKGITIVTAKPTKPPKAPKPRAAVPALTGSILGMGLGSGKPLIPSGPKAGGWGGSGESESGPGGRKPKSPFTKRQLERYREVLRHKRAELLGDIDSMETEALKSQSGSLSHLPQHMAEQGSETYEQSLSLDLAAADRVLLREIDAALKRIADRTFGLCERTGKPISKERLAELPWARYSIEAAREMERRTS